MAQRFIKITQANVRKLKAGQRLAENGIEVEALTNGDNRYSVNFMVDGQRIHRVIGVETDGSTRTQAEDFIAQRRSEAKEGRLRLPKGRKNHLNFAEASGKYMERLEQGGGKDIKSKIHRLRDHLVPFFGRMVLPRICTHDVDCYKKQRLDAGAAAATVNRETQILRHILNKAVEWEWIDHHSPCLIKKLPEPPGRIIYLKAEQVYQLTEAAKKDTCPIIAPFIFIALGTAMRRMEILSIRIENIDIDKRVIYIPKAKAGARQQPMTASLAEYLKQYLAGIPRREGWLFPANSSTGHAMNIEKPFRRCVAAAGLKVNDVTRHTLRHTAITLLARSGVDPVIIQRISGHHSIEMVMRYTHADNEDVRAAMDKLETRYNQPALIQRAKELSNAAKKPRLRRVK